MKLRDFLLLIIAIGALASLVIGRPIWEVF